MKHKPFTKLTSAILSAAMALSSAPAALTVTADAADAAGTVFATDFEDGDVTKFTNRGGDDTTEISVSDEFAVSGGKALLASGRTKDWNGPAFRLDTVCEPYTEYYVSFKFKGRYYTNSTVSFQFDNADGKTEYKNLLQNLNGSDWITVENLKVSFTDEMKNVFVYLEGGQDDIFIDDFSIVEVPAVDIQQDIPSISSIYSQYFKLGTAITADNLASKPFMALVDKHFDGSMTCGNEMKPESVLDHDACLKYVEENGDDTVPQVSFSKAKGILNYCDKHNTPVRVHTLVWHSQTPDWFFKENYDPEGEWVSKEKMILRLENYIKNYFETLTELYPNIDFYACDVVNEAWLEDGSAREPGSYNNGNGHGTSAWVRIFGDNSFIEYAFKYARQYAPEGCKLYYNDYNEFMDGKQGAILKTVTDLKEKGLIDGIGMQSHLDARDSMSTAFPTIGMYEKAIVKYIETGLDIQITELDVRVPENSGDKYFELQSQYYDEVMKTLVKYHDNISAVVFWGVTDELSWYSSQQPLLFDKDYTAKPAFYGITDGREVPVTSSKATTASTTKTETTTTFEAVTTASETSADTTTGNSEVTLIGDANLDKKVSVADAVAILQSIANKDKYALKPEAAANADCYDPGDGVTANDALAIQKLDAGAIESLPETSK